MFDGIIDINHGKEIDFDQVRGAGIIAIIHKATEGATFRDDQYQVRRTTAKADGFLWGAYHFSSGSTVADQVRNFLDYAQPTDLEFLALDWEESTSGANMTLAQAEEFVQRVHDEVGRYPAVYGGGMMRTELTNVTTSVLSQCPLWHQRYASTPKGIPAIWPTYTLWQYTDGVDGADPKVTNGISAPAGVSDRSRFQGTETDLREQWPFR